MDEALRKRAMAMGAYCFADDMASWRGNSLPAALLEHLPGRSKRMTYALIMGSDADANTALAVQLAAEAERAPVNARGQDRCILLFSERNSDAELLSGLNARLAAMPGAQGCMLVQVHARRSAVLRLFKESPVFLPMTCGCYARLELLVIGSGMLAEEMLCQCYWFCQLSDPGTGERIPLVLHACTQTQQEAQQLELRLRNRMPGAFASHPETFQFHFSGTSDLPPDLLQREALREVSCAMICLDGDSQACEAALTIQRSFCRREMKRGRPTSLYVAMQSQQLAQCLEARCETVRRSCGSACHVRSFATRSECLSYRSVFCDELLYYAAVVNEAYQEGRGAGACSMLNMLRDSYRMYSSLALAVHCSAKLCSCGVLEPSDFPLLTRERLEVAIRSFLERVQEPAQRRKMAVLEHDRWIAYMESIGFEAISAEDMAQMQHGERYQTRSVELRLHCCLVPRSDRGFMNREDDPDLQVREMDQWRRSRPDPQWDELDLLSWEQHRFASDFYRSKGLDPEGQSLPGLYQNYKICDEQLLGALMENMLDYLQRDGNPFTIGDLLFLESKQVCDGDAAQADPAQGDKEE